MDEQAESAYLSNVLQNKMKPIRINIKYKIILVNFIKELIVNLNFFSCICKKICISLFKKIIVYL